MSDVLFTLGIGGLCYALGWLSGTFTQGRIRVLAAAHRLRKRRPYTVNIDYNFAVSALENAGYKVERAQERLH